MKLFIQAMKSNGYALKKAFELRGSEESKQWLSLAKQHGEEMQKHSSFMGKRPMKENKMEV